jgi:hypothetical protein
MTVKSLIGLLGQLPEDAQVTVLGQKDIRIQFNDANATDMLAMWARGFAITAHSTNGYVDLSVD